MTGGNGISELMFILEWLLIVEITGLIAFPLTASFFSNLADKGYSIAKPVGLLVITYMTWLSVSLGMASFGTGIIAVSFLVLAAVGLRYFKTEILSLRDLAIKSELVFLVSFFIFLYIVMNRPDIYGPNSEDFMDLGFLQSILRSTHFPPGDPWIAGESLSYYYFGHLAVAILTKLSGIPSSITYNLAIAMFFGLTAQAAYGVVYNLTQRSFYGLLGTIFVSVSGIISGFLQLLVYLIPGSRGYIRYDPLDSPDILHWLTGFDFWNSISIIPQTFNYYPYHTFAHVYLHAHMMSIPFQVMLITAGLSLFKAENIRKWEILVTGLFVGFLAGLNAWEYPTYIIFVCAIFFIKYRKGSAYPGIQTVALSIIMYLPYYLSRDEGGFRGIQFVAQRTTLMDFIEIFALFLFLMISFLLVYYRDNRRNINISRSNAILILTIVLAMLTAAMVSDFQTLPLLAFLIFVPAYGIIKLGDQEIGFALLLVLMGSLIALFTEIFYIEDSMPWPRFNTVMKLHLQVWVLWGVASAYAVYYAGRQFSLKSRSGAIWSFILITLIFASLIHPIASTTSWLSGGTFFGTSTNGTLDGMTYLVKTNREDYMAIKWINQNITGTPVILEGPGNSYSYSSRISTFTGLPTVIGWKSHLQMYNSNWSDIDGRISDVDTIYSTDDSDLALHLMKKYKVQYVYIGEIEIDKYPAAGLKKFSDSQHFELIYNDISLIYKIR